MKKKIVGKSGKEYWVTVDPNFDINDPNIEVGPELDTKYMRSIGMVNGLKPKAFSELSEEEQKLFSDLNKDDSTETEGV